MTQLVSHTHCFNEEAVHLSWIYSDAIYTILHVQRQIGRALQRDPIHINAALLHKFDKSSGSFMLLLKMLFLNEVKNAINYVHQIHHHIL